MLAARQETALCHIDPCDKLSARTFGGVSELANVDNAGVGQRKCCLESRVRCKIGPYATQNSGSCMEVIYGKKGHGEGRSRGTAAR